eukprot:NODE_4_length_55019_cov_0.425091.p29 type:complete len:197 gc:universal NODE_4_length_55019_cov_0.425091:33219-32629(-)
MRRLVAIYHDERKDNRVFMKLKNTRKRAHCSDMIYVITLYSLFIFNPELSKLLRSRVYSLFIRGISLKQRSKMQPNLQLKIQLPYHWSEETAKNYFYRHCPTASLQLEGKSGILIFKCYADMLDAMKCSSIPHLNSTPTLQMYYDTKYFLVHESIFHSHQQQGTFKFSLSKQERLNECFLVLYVNLEIRICCFSST